MIEPPNYTPPTGWMIAGYRIFPAESSSCLPRFNKYSEKPVTYYTELRDRSEGFTAIVRQSHDHRLRLDWLLFKPALGKDRPRVEMRGEPHTKTTQSNFGFQEEFQIAV